MNDNSHASDKPLRADDRLIRPSDLPGFHAFEQALATDLIKLVDRWSSWAAPNASRRPCRARPLRTSGAKPRKPR